ncbi:hypothetical protein [Thauera sp. SDU_THAU2]|uniref:hypothetical protein n=1 Tax=Thauera sp. SDU_THAU2 TaxID=3136633 RepID=UPI00311E051E
MLREIQRHPGVVYAALVPNLRGAEQAIESGADRLNLVMSASESHNLSNLRMTPGQSFEALAGVAAVARDAGVPVNVSLSCSFGCPMKGDVSIATVMHWCERHVDELGAQGITLCATTGMAFPSQVHELTTAFRARWPEQSLTLHFHNTRGLGMGNVLAAIDAGAGPLRQHPGRAGWLSLYARCFRQRVHGRGGPWPGAHGVRHRCGPGSA